MGMLQLLQESGCGFACATPKEIDAALAASTGPDGIMLLEPCKPRMHLSYAQQRLPAVMVLCRLHGTGSWMRQTQPAYQSLASRSTWVWSSWTRQRWTGLWGQRVK